MSDREKAGRIIRSCFLFVGFLVGVIIISSIFLQDEEYTPTWLAFVCLLVSGLLTSFCMKRGKNAKGEKEQRKKGMRSGLRNFGTYMAFFLITLAVISAIFEDEETWPDWVPFVGFIVPGILTHAYNKIKYRMLCKEKQIRNHIDLPETIKPVISVTAPEAPSMPKYIPEPNTHVSELDLIRRMEDHFAFVYRAVINKLCTLEECVSVFENTCKYFESQDLPLAAEIRLEQLKEEYKPKFHAPNPMVNVDNMDGTHFEEWCANLLEKAGYHSITRTGGSGDQGVDITAEKDGIKFAFQCKRYQSALGNTPVQEINSGRMMYNCQIGVVMTNSTFTQGAKTLAEKTGVLLWDRDKLKTMIKEMYDLPIDVNYMPIVDNIKPK